MSVDNTLTHPKNKLLAALPCTEYERLAPHLQIVRLSNQQVIYDIAEPIAYAYFPQGSIISELAMMDDGSTVEVALVGHEGMAGIPIILGDNISSIKAIVQIPGYSVRLNADVLKTEFDRGGSLQRLLLRYVQAVITEMAQGTACNRLHRLEKRLSRWLLKVSDRLGSQEFPLTQEFIAEMLGVRRSGVTVAAGILSQSGIISYHRGYITILDREALEATSCECYRIVKAEFTRLLGDLPVCKHR
ncbi:Crp/Fnr family transcriptional regulator [Nostoc sp. 106C]|uniref:Crp/Fnr family transcriptional regulator n=1 Tax=Nostoc sp. 106C TaxID=1932667 RepID=UPI000A3851BA|nr:Crp/Fnr family transcriptional regulator [Nostoc sp. 106C]OUL32126.1 Crp/Fnr family transcriptional regulator [Nostoc sp. 106C]